ncbi:CD63 antigen [Prorops nasuta]|uniref:CD63 antigen n=1 Tax=Prorops nasuta TaxID=863751 RepID=UPI0034D00225
MESCGLSLVKYILFIFNLIFAISGIGIIIAGGVVLADVGDFSHFMESGIIAPSVVLIVAGAIVFLIAFLGCYGAIKENYGMLIAFAVALLIIFVIELAVGIAAACLKNNFRMELKNSLKESIKNYTDVDRVTWDSMQKKLKCCGVDSYEDWTSNSRFSASLPNSCCMNDNPTLACQSGSPSLYKGGCFEQLEELVESSAAVLIGVGIGIAFIEIAGIVLACCLASSIKRGQADK